MINTQTEIFRGYGKICELSAQTAAECRFGGEVETALAARADVVLTNAETDNGEVRYSGKVRFLIVYEDSQRRVCRAEKGAEFSAKIKDTNCCPAFAARVSLNVENVSVRREGAGVYATALIGADVSLYGEQSFEYLTDGDLILKRETAAVPIVHLCGGNAETDDEFETEFLGDILLHSETVDLSDVCCESGILRAEGEINLGLLALKEENTLVSYERLVPFRLEIPCEAASFGCGAEAKVSVANVSLAADTDEEKGKCRIRAEFTLNVEGCVYKETKIETVTDAFSTENAVELCYSELKSESAGALSHTTERISGKAALSAPIDFSDVLQAVILERAEANAVETESGRRAEGVAAATLLMLSSDGSHRGVEISLPFSVPLPGGGAVSVMVCGMSARQRQEGEIEAEATLKISVSERAVFFLKQASGIREGEKLQESNCAASVFIPRAGDGLWELAKRLKKPPEEVSASNPEITFPIREGQRVIIYRKKSLTGQTK